MNVFLKRLLPNHLVHTSLVLVIFYKVFSLTTPLLQKLKLVHFFSAFFQLVFLPYHLIRFFQQISFSSDYRSSYWRPIEAFLLLFITAFSDCFLAPIICMSRLLSCYFLKNFRHFLFLGCIFITKIKDVLRQFNKPSILNLGHFLQKEYFSFELLLHPSEVFFQLVYLQI